MSSSNSFYSLIGTMILVIAALFCGEASAAGAGELVRFEKTEPHMGVPFRIVLYSKSEATANEAFRAAFERIATLNRIMSDYDGDSELMRLCRSSGVGRPVAVSHDLFHVLEHARTISAASNGAFDVTVGPAVRLWRRARRQKQFPAEDRLADARAAIGYQFVKLDPAARTVELLRDQMQLDLGGIAKGYAVDEALRVLKQLGIEHALVDGSGDLAVSAAPPGTSGWVVGIAALKRPDADPTEFLTLEHQAIATSGDVYQFVEIDGVRYSHLIDPRTGIGLSIPSSVTVLAGNCTDADAWASALSVLEPCTGLAIIAKREKLSALIVRLEQSEPVTYRSCDFPTITAGKPAQE